MISLSVDRGSSVKPPGDVVNVVALNRAADEVMNLVDRERERSRRPISVSTHDMSSLIDTDNAKRVAQDVDDTLWEVQETRLRHHNQPTLNFVLLMIAGGAIAACGTLSHESTALIAIVAAGVIAPGFEPLAKLPISIVLRRGGVLLHGLQSTAIGYFALFAGAAVTALCLHAGGSISPHTLTTSHLAHEILHPSAFDLVISGAGALAGVIMIASDNTSLLAGPLIALALIPAAAILGISAAVANGHDAALSVARLAIDAGLVIVAGLLLFGWKQLRAHRRRPLV